MKIERAIFAIAAASLFLAGANAAGAQESILYSFGSPACAAQPDSAPVFDTKGNLYGTCLNISGDGFVYELSPKAGGGWTENAIYTFGADGTTDKGSGPNGVIFDAQKTNLFGTTSAGGSQGGGVVYELTPSSSGWTETVLYNFGTNGANDGIVPTGSLAFDASGNLYGTTSEGGANFNSGTAFELTPKTGGAWTETVIHSFSLFDSVGSSPQNGLIFDAKGNLYGTTNGGAGTVFELSPASGEAWTVQPIGYFSAFSNPAGNLIFDGSGNLYGASTGGGANGNGAVYEWSPGSGGTWTGGVIYSFGQTAKDGTSPTAGVILGPEGVLYGTTASGGQFSGTGAPAGYGTIFELIPGAGSWTEKILYNFDDPSDNGGFHPDTDLTLDAAGNIYGSSSGGSGDTGAVFELTSPTTVDLPQISPAPGTYIQAQSVEIADPTPDATIYYTTNGNTPTTASTKYMGAFTVAATETVEAIAVAAGLTDSPVATAKYSITPPAPTPVFSPVAGTYATAQKVTISDATPGAVIYYTTNGTTPTTSSAKFSTAIPVPSSVTLKAAAIAPGYSISEVGGAIYTIETPAATPVIAPAAGTYIPPQHVTITDATAGAVIYYTTNGTAPTTLSAKYTGAITMASTATVETVEAIAVASDYLQSAVATAKYTITPPAATPAFSPVAGRYATAQKVTITDATSAAVIYYTTNGTAPTTSSTRYSGAIAVSASKTIKAIASASGYVASAVATAAYTIETPAATPVFGLPTGTYGGTQMVTITDATAGATIFYTTNGTAPSSSSTKYSSAIAVKATETVEAIAVASGSLNSAVATAKYTILPFAATPVISPASDTYAVAQPVTITDATAGAVIYYTIDGTTPTTSSLKYSGPIVASYSETLQAIAIAPGYAASQVAAANYSITTAEGWKEKILYSFGATPKDGLGPLASLVFDAAGNLYGTTSVGGANGSGTVFGLTPAAGGGWTEKVLYNFGATATDASGPAAPMIFDAKGNLYGTTVSGGKHGDGAVFELSPGTGGAWTETLLYSFGASSKDGQSPQGGLIFDGKGNLYGTTQGGGAYATKYSSGGTFYELTPGAGGAWTESFSYSFGSASDGISPTGGLTFDANGNLYGTTQTGGAHGTCCYGGTVFEFSPAAGNGWTEHVLYSFYFNGIDGYSPSGGVIFDPKGNLYGATGGGGTSHWGTVFELTPGAAGAWSEKLLYTFADHDNGLGPNGNLILDAKGNLYGTTVFGGTIAWGTAANYPLGTVFELSPTAAGGWIEKPLYSFGAGNIGTVTSPGNDGINPTAGVIRDAKGNLYGITQYSGAHGNVDTVDGIVFEIQSITAAAPVFTPAAGTYVSGQKVTISDGTPGAVIYFTTNGATPTVDSTRYTAPITLTAAETIKAIAIDPAYTTSPVASAAYTIGPPAATPVITPAPGKYAAAQTIAISDATSGATIYYSTNGAAPTTSSAKYVAAFKLSATATVKAVAVAKGYAQSGIASSAYSIETTAAWQVFSPAARKPGTQRIQAHIAHGADQVSVVQHNRGKAALEQMAGPASAGVDEVGVPPVSFADGAAKVAGSHGSQDQAHVVQPQATDPHRNGGLQRPLGQHIKVNFVVGILKDDGLGRLPRCETWYGSAGTSIRAKRAMRSALAWNPHRTISSAAQARTSAF